MSSEDMDMDYEQIQDIENLKKEIICIIEDLYSCKFIGRIFVRPIDPIGYEVSIDLLHNTKPIFISGEFEHNKFLKYIREELRDRMLIDSHLFSLHRYKYYDPVSTYNILNK